jgi:hypothetical protein
MNLIKEGKVSKFANVLFVFMFFATSIVARASHLRVQDDTVKVPNVGSTPTINGLGDDPCWQNAHWQTIDQVWIPWGGSVEPDDYTGRYKVVWSSTENLLYFLVEITDDVFVDGYVFGPGDYYQYDIVEVFIDEDKSGGIHNYEVGGVNAENAFAYHIVVNAPEDGEVNNDFVVCDMAGNTYTVNYAGHFPELAMRKNGNQYTWEFSLAVYNDTYNNSNPEASRVKLSENKIIGLSLAYCDNDAPDGTRDNFFGSVWVPEAEYNNHWINADGFGTLKLVPEGSGVEDDFPIEDKYLQIYPNPFKEKTLIEFFLPKPSEVIVEVSDVLGESVDTVIETSLQAGRHKIPWTPKGIPPGIYFCRIKTNSFTDIKKILLIK